MPTPAQCLPCSPPGLRRLLLSGGEGARAARRGSRGARQPGRVAQRSGPGAGRGLVPLPGEARRGPRATRGRRQRKVNGACPRRRPRPPRPDPPVPSCSRAAARGAGPGPSPAHSGVAGPGAALVLAGRGRSRSRSPGAGAFLAAGITRGAGRGAGRGWRRGRTAPRQPPLPAAAPRLSRILRPRGPEPALVLCTAERSGLKWRRLSPARAAPAGLPGGAGLRPRPPHRTARTPGPSLPTPGLRREWREPAFCPDLTMGAGNKGRAGTWRGLRRPTGERAVRAAARPSAASPGPGCRGVACDPSDAPGRGRSRPRAARRQELPGRPRKAPRRAPREARPGPLCEPGLRARARQRPAGPRSDHAEERAAGPGPAGAGVGAPGRTSVQRPLGQAGASSEEELGSQGRVLGRDERPRPPGCWGWGCLCSSSWQE